MAEGDGSEGEGGGGGPRDAAPSAPKPTPALSGAAATGRVAPTAKKSPALSAAPTTRGIAPTSRARPALSGAATTGGPVTSKARPALSNAPATTAPSTPRAAEGSEASAPIGRRPLVSKEAKAELAKRRQPFYERIPPSVLKVLAGAAGLAVLVLVAVWGYGWYTRSRNPDEFAVKEQLNAFRFDDDRGHFETVDRMGPTGVETSIRLLVDRTPAEISGGHSTTTTGELAMMYLMHYAARIKVEPPPKAVESVRNGLPTLDGNAWSELQRVWTAWFAQVQSKGLALPKS